MISCTYNLKYINKSGSPVYIHVREYANGCTWVGIYPICKGPVSLDKVDKVAREQYASYDLSEQPVEIVP